MIGKRPAEGSPTSDFKKNFACDWKSLKPKLGPGLIEIMRPIPLKRVDTKCPFPE